MRLYKAIFISSLTHLTVLGLLTFEFNQTLNLQSQHLEIEISPLTQLQAPQAKRPKDKSPSAQNLTQNLETTHSINTIRAIHTPSPTYPLQSRKKFEQGVVKLKVLISQFGVASEIQLLESSGFEQLDQAAKDALLKWTFNNPLQKPVWIEKKFRFKLASQ